MSFLVTIILYIYQENKPVLRFRIIFVRLLLHVKFCIQYHIVSATCGSGSDSDPTIN
jgi:hypothetical protein